MDDILYFISHSANDKKLAEMFFSYYTESLGIPEERIFCASITKQIPIGTKNYLEYIKDALLRSRNGTMIAIITSSFMLSDFCKYEIGAAWILGIQIYPILFPPIEYGEKQLVGSPLSLIQGLKIDKNSVSSTTQDVLGNLFEIAKGNKEIEEYISHVPEFTRWNKIGKLVQNITNCLKNVEETRINIDILRQTCNVYHENADKRTLIAVKDVDDQYVTLKIDFTYSQPDFVGYYIRPLSPKDWRPFIENKYYLRFEAVSCSDEINELIVELKGIHYQIADKRCELSSKGWTNSNISLGAFDSSEEEWKEMKEICFVIKPDCLSTKTGSIRIRNLRIEKDPMF